MAAVEVCHRIAWRELQDLRKVGDGLAVALSIGQRDPAESVCVSEVRVGSNGRGERRSGLLVSALSMELLSAAQNIAGRLAFWRPSLQQPGQEEPHGRPGDDQGEQVAPRHKPLRRWLAPTAAPAMEEIHGVPQKNKPAWNSRLKLYPGH